MPNEVNIKITATDLTGPAFAAALAKMEAFKKAANGMTDKAGGETLGNLLLPSNQQTSQFLTYMKQRMQSLGLADIADVNVQPGTLTSRLMLLKRLIQQAGISDLLDVNLNQSSLTAGLSRIANITETIPINFDIGKLPDFTMRGLSIPINFDASKIPQFGNVSSITAWSDAVKAAETSIVSWDDAVAIADESSDKLGISWDDAAAHAHSFGEYVADTTDNLHDSSNAFSDALRSVLGYAASLDDGTKYGSMFGSLFSNMLPNLSNLWDKVTNSASGSYRVLQFLGDYTGDALLNAASSAGNAWRGFNTEISNGFPILRAFGSYIGSTFINALGNAGAGIASFGRGLDNFALSGIALAARALSYFNDDISRGIPLWQSGGILWGGLGGHLSLFGGALNGLLPRFIATASGIHILTDGIIEIVATLLPAIVGLGAFAAAAIDTSTEVYFHFKNLNYVTDTLSESMGSAAGNIYPLTGAFAKMNQAAQPQVYVLLGEGLQAINKNAGVLATVASSAGTVIDQLGARITYAVTSGTGFNVFTKNAAADLSGWGNNIGNVFGILGNFLKVMPGYAEVILNVFGTVSQALENISGSKLGQTLLGAGLAIHGFILYVGLLGTAVAWLASTGLGALAGGFLRVTLALDALGATEAADAIAGIAPALESLAALPWGWIGIAAAGIGVLIYKFVSAKSAAQDFAAGVQSSITAVKVDVLGGTIADAILNYGTAFYYAKQQADLLAVSSAHVVMVSNGKYSTSPIVEYSQAYYAARQNVADYSATLQLAESDQKTYNSNIAVAAHTFGSAQAALAAFSNAGITSNDLLTTSKQQLAEYIIEAEGYVDAVKAMSLGTGRQAAALNALSGPEQYLGDFLKSAQAITQAEDNLMNAVTAGETTLDTFALGLATMTSNFAGTSKAASTASHTLDDIKSSASLAGAAMGGTTQADYTLQQSFYSQITAGQGVIDALTQQEASTKSLTTATATIAAQMLPFAGNNDAARATIIAMINDALGPGTVSLKNLNTWVGKNATSMQGFNNIVAQSTIKAGQLANVLQTQLTSQFQADLLKSSGATQAMQQFTNALVHGGDQTAAYHGARNQLILDLEKTGLSAAQAKNYVSNLQGQINGLKGNTVNVGVHMSGSGGILESSTLPGESQSTAHLELGGLRKGGLLPGFGGGDTLLRALEPGEAVVDKYKTRQYAGLLAMMGVPGMSAGGIVDTVGGYGSTFSGDWGDYFAKLALANFRKNAATAFKRTSDSAPSGGPGGGSPLANMHLAQSLYPAYAAIPAVWNAWNNVAMAESGWNQYALNAASGAYGIAQALPPTKYPFAGQAAGGSNPTAQITWMWDYMATRWGGPEGAWANEQAYHWYDNGGWLKPGMNMMMNGTGKYEHLTPDSGGGNSVSLEVTGGNSDFEQFMLKMIRKYVRVRGGGNVQTAFGRNH